MGLIQEISKSIKVGFPYKGSGEDEKQSQVYPFSERLVATLSYVYFVAPAVLLFSTGETGFIKLHAKHGLVFLLASISSLIFPFWIKYPILIVCLVGMFFSASRAWKGKTIFIPYLTPILQDFEI